MDGLTDVTTPRVNIMIYNGRVWDGMVDQEYHICTFKMASLIVMVQ